MANNFILCIETSSEVCSVALSNSGLCLSVKSVNEPNAHGSILTVLIEQLLQENNLEFSNLSAVAISDGPGSYTGLRIGLSVAKGICYGANIPLIAISTLKHMVFGSTVSADFYFPMLDARRMEVYGALIIRSGEFEISPFPCLVDHYNWIDILVDRPICFLGNGLPKAKKILSQFPHALFDDKYSISATSMCILAEAKWIERDFVDVAYHTPFYLKEANVTVSKKKAL